MEPKMLDKKNHIDMNTGCLCRYIRSDTEYFRPHYHNYYELFMIINGNVRHVVNGKTQILSEGQLLFIRDFDVHDYIRVDDEYFEIINFAFTKEMFDALFNYLGKAADKNRLLGPKLPPLASLLPGEKEKLFYSLTEINAAGKAEDVNLKAKLILADTFLKYFYLNANKRKEISVPLWLEMTYEKMTKPQNFTVGTERMYEISGKSREHVSREFKKYYNTTPTEFVTRLRLGMAVNLLLTSNLSATDICYECGFENLSWFYKCFYKKFEKTPVLYRKENSRFF